jgi:hypothetical protein
MDLKCPVCGSNRFFVEDGARTVFFSLHPSGAPFEVSPPEAVAQLQGELVLHCSGCAWNGTWRELEGAT